MTNGTIPTTEKGLTGVRFGRSRLLAASGGALFGAAVGLFGKTGQAWALCGSASPCGPSSKCCCCSGTFCCQGGCHERHNECNGFSDRCWNVCAPNNRITCCDWWTGNNEPCICREATGPPC